MPKGTLYMSLLSKRLVSIAASTIVLSLVSVSANADTDVLTGGAQFGGITDGATSTYKFTDSMVLNSIGFYTPGGSYEFLEYSLKGSTYRYGVDFFDNNLMSENDFSWLTINPQAMVTNEVVTVYTKNETYNSNGQRTGTNTGLFKLFTVNPSAKVSYVGLVASPFGSQPLIGWTNSNLRVSNVAPEPGSFALALTGGATLLGICIRRRRNAA